MKKLKVQKTVGKIYETLQYDLFDFFIENRSVEANATHVNRLVELIEEGYTLPPILVTEGGLIIDGQHRYTAWKKLGKPIKYYFGVYNGREQLGIMNGEGQKQWSLDEHVVSIGKNNPDYVILKQYRDKTNIGYRALTEILGGAYLSNPSIKKGEFKCTQLKKAEKFFEIYNVKFDGIKNNELQLPVFRLWCLGDIDMDRLSSICKVNQSELKKVRNIAAMMEFLVNEYNHNLKKFRIKMMFTPKGKIVYSFPYVKGSQV